MAPCFEVIKRTIESMTDYSITIKSISDHPITIESMTDLFITIDNSQLMEYMMTVCYRPSLITC